MKLTRSLLLLSLLIFAGCRKIPDENKDRMAMYYILNNTPLSSRTSFWDSHKCEYNSRTETVSLRSREFGKDSSWYNLRIYGYNIKGPGTYNLGGKARGSISVTCFEGPRLIEEYITDSIRTGELTITELDTVNQRIRGTFSTKVYSWQNKVEGQITDGHFNLGLRLKN